MPNATIGQYEFIALQGRLSPPQHGWARIDEPWENGVGLARLGRKGEVERILTWSEFGSAVAAQQSLVAYEFMANSIIDINVLIGASPVIYPFYKILFVRDVTDFPYTPVSGSGLHYRLIVEWTLIQVTGDWGEQIGN